MNKSDLIYNSKLYKAFKPFYSGIGHVLMFHRVCNDNSNILNRYLQVSPEYLEKVILHFKSGNIDIITLDECYSRLLSKGKVKQFVVFTFDDGYFDILTHALPVFKKHNTPFSLFLASCYPDNRIILWWYLLEDVIMKNDIITYTEEGVKYCFNSKSMEEKMNAFWKIRRHIMETNQENLPKRLHAIFGAYYTDLFDLTKKLAISWEQVSELSKNPLVTIGAHTVNHLALSKLTEDKVVEEISESIKQIREKTGKKAEYLAYPYGSSSEANTREYNISSNCQIKMAFTAISGNIFKHHARNLHSLPRIGIDESWKISDIDLYINGFTPFIKKIIAYKTKRQERKP